MQVSEQKLTRSNAAAVKKEVLAAAKGHDAVLDLSNVKTLDSSAVAVVLAWLREVQEQGATPVLVGVPDKMMSLARLYGVHGLLKPYVRMANF